MPVRLNGSTSGYVELKSPAVAGTASLELPTDSIKPGLVLINSTTFSSTTSISINNCFSSAYQSYRIVISELGSTSLGNISIRLRAGGVDDTTANGYYSAWSGYAYAANTSVGRIIDNYWFGSYADTGPLNVVSFDIASPYTTANTVYTGSEINDNSVLTIGGFHTVGAAFDGITLYSLISSNIQGSIRVYGYRNSL